MRIFDQLKTIARNLTRSTELLDSINAGVVNEQRILNEKLTRLIEIQKALLERQEAELATRARQIELFEEFLRKAVTREQARFQALLLERQEAELATRARQIELFEEFQRKALTREQARFQALVDNQNAQVAFQRAQIEMIGEVLKDAIAAREGGAAAVASEPPAGEPARRADERRG
jgi:3'-phosphoadenosine 5'-phosphosulfate sulfotransferase